MRGGRDELVNVDERYRVGVGQSIVSSVEGVAAWAILLVNTWSNLFEIQIRILTM